ncbi:HAD-IA family hydrolase [Rheinheimera sp. MMS21-TC3]|uniref:HAD-IA family hydrolase n=1 Tax=Rheinheimera sp. MMS21-TC3 TaxID=3072790 RepID=UPI0028C45907|nr:HAD-IA family hydrolase [Rheinheimera sp. MMS21-TC3]WNO59721.1 HAD-IA family hydrolase [Rheinheimera sp. MMS21-TC3]
MQIYKQLQPIQTLSFDLDDTLYNNKPVIAAAEHAMLQALGQQLPSKIKTDNAFWLQQRQLLAIANPEIRHDLGRWRLLSLEAGLLRLKFNQTDAKNIADIAYSAFLQQRTNISVDIKIKQLLAELAKYYKLIAITNGNACIDKMDIGHWFEFSLQAGPDGRMKPYSDLFLNAAKQLKLAPAQILHIGDSHRADVIGALNAGCQTAWLDHHNSSISILPHIRLTDVHMLKGLIANN